MTKSITLFCLALFLCCSKNNPVSTVTEKDPRFYGIWVDTSRISTDTLTFLTDSYVNRFRNSDLGSFIIYYGTWGINESKIYYYEKFASYYDTSKTIIGNSFYNTPIETNYTFGFNGVNELWIYSINSSGQNIATIYKKVK